MAKVVVYLCRVCGLIPPDLVEEASIVVPWLPSKYGCKKCGGYVQRIEKEKK